MLLIVTLAFLVMYVPLALPYSSSQFAGNTDDAANSFAAASPFPPAAPAGVAATSQTDVAVPMSWSTANLATDYEVEYRAVGAPAWVSPTVTTASTSTTVTGLINGTTYEFQVRVTPVTATPGAPAAPAVAGTPTTNANFSTVATTSVTKPTGLTDGELVVATISAVKTVIPEGSGPCQPPVVGLM